MINQEPMMKLIFLTSFLIFLTSIRGWGQILHENYELDYIVLEKNHPDYNRDVRFRLVMDGFPKFRVKLEKWQFLPTNPGISTLTFIKSVDLCEDAKVSVLNSYIANQDAIYLGFAELLVEGEQCNVHVKYLRKFTTIGHIESPKISAFISDSATEKVAIEINEYSPHFKYDYQARRDPDVFDVTEQKGGICVWGGCTRPHTSFTIRGNDVRAIKLLSLGAVISLEKGVIENLKKRGQAYAEIYGNYKGSEIEFIDANGDVIGRTKLE